MFPADFRLYLASQSPRRHSLLRDLGVPFQVVAAEVCEQMAGEAAAVLAERNALAKVEAARLPEEAAAGSFVLGTDTLVTVGGRVLGKPGSATAASEMLRMLAGQTHEVVSGVALARIGEGIQVAHAVTAVTFLPLDERAVSSYVASREWVDKAGGYGVQGLAGLFVAGIHGEYSNVVGLPLCLLSRLFAQAGFDLLGRRWL